MRNLFTPVFLVCIIFPACFFFLETVNHPLIYWFFYILTAAAPACFFFKKYRAAYVLLALAMGFLMGARLVEQKNAFQQTVDSLAAIPSDCYVTLEGRVNAFPEIHHRHSIVYMEVQRVRWAKNTRKFNFNIRLKIDGCLDRLKRSDRVTIEAKVFKTTFSRNFFPNPMVNLQLVRRTHANGHCKSAGLVTVNRQTNWFWRVTGMWRNQIRRVIEKKYKSGGNGMDRRGVLLQAVLTGQRAQLSNRDKEQLISAGVYHLLAISGAHIGIIALGCLGLLKLLKVPLKKRYVITAIVLVLFLILSGFRLSAQRAVLMALLLFTARIFRLEKNLYNIISFCGILLLARNPASFLDAGFILTFTLTIVIVTGREIVPPLIKQTSYFGELLSANLSASLAALPLSLFFFKRYSFAAAMAGLLLVPLTGVIIGLGFLLIPLAPLSSTLCQLLLVVIDLPLRLFFLIVTFFSQIIHLNIYNASPPVFLVILIPGLYCLIPRCRSTLQKISLFLVILLLCLGISIKLCPYSPKRLEVFYLDVGQGDAQIVVFPGGDGLLIDGGGVYYSEFQVGRNILLPFILQKRIRIRWIAVSHYHADHIRGVDEILRILKPEQVWLSSRAPEDPLYRELLEKTPGSSAVRYITAPFTFTHKGCRVQWLHPSSLIHATRSKNSHSQVIKISDAFNSFLFTGDIEIQSEEELVDQVCSGLRADVLKVPHHGSATSSSSALLECVRPRLAIFSYARYNRFNFPHWKVIDRYKRRGIPYLSTAWRGGIQLVSLPGKIEVRCSGLSAEFFLNKDN